MEVEKRIPLTNRRKDVVRKGVYAHAFAECRAEIETFTSCMEGRMFSVIYACRDQNRAMNDCLHKYTNPESMDKAYAAEERRLAEKRIADKEVKGAVDAR